MLKEKGLKSSISAKVSKRTGKTRDGKKYATPVDQTKKYKKFYSPDYKVPDTSSAEETARLVGEFADSVDVYQKKAEAAMAKTEKRTKGIAMTVEAVEDYDKLASKGDELLAGEVETEPTEVPGFLSEYTDKGESVGIATDKAKKEKRGSKGSKKRNNKKKSKPLRQPPSQKATKWLP